MANSLSGHDEINFSKALSGSTIQLTTSELPISDQLTIDGSTLPTPIAIDASAADATPDIEDGLGIRIFNVDDSNPDQEIAVSISGLTLTGGDVTGGGGAIESRENLTLTDSTIANNFATTYGGGLRSLDYASFELTRVTISGNSAATGGGVDASFYAVARNGAGVITDSNITGNQAIKGGGLAARIMYGFELDVTDSQVSNNAGGGMSIYASFNASATIHSSTISDNAGRGGLDLSAGFNSGITVENCLISGNVAANGGGARVDTFEGLVTFRDTTISNNSAGVGGGVNLTGLEYGGVRLLDSTISGNSAGGQGGGIYAYASGGTMVELRRTTVSGNVASIGGGLQAGLSSGGLAGGFVTIDGSTFSGNFAESIGGAMQLQIGPINGGTGVRIRNSTVSGNSSNGAAGGIASDTYDSGGVTSIEFSTIAANVADADGSGDPSDGGAGLLATGPGSVLLDHTIVADNYRHAVADDVFGTVSAKFSLFESNLSGGTISGIGNLFGTAPQLVPLAENGGPTKTMALLTSSPAVDAGDPKSIEGEQNVPEFDQRGTGYHRVSGLAVDLGAFESGTAIDGDFTNDSAYDCEDVDSLVAAIAAGKDNVQFDLNGDGLVNYVDRDHWLAEAGSNNLGPESRYEMGDANLDGSVDGDDFMIWSQNKFTENAAWCAADFDADGFVSGYDFLIWNAFKTTSSNTAERDCRPYDLQADEPTSDRPDCGAIGNSIEESNAADVANVPNTRQIGRHREATTEMPNRASFFRGLRSSLTLRLLSERFHS